ncbi:MAG: PAS domain-containing protein, partial [Phycisphaerae bacterium]
MADWRQPERLSQTGQRVFECLSLGLVVFDTQLQIVHHNPAAAFLVQNHTAVDEALNAGTVEGHYQDWPKALREVLEHGRQSRFDQVVYRDASGRELLLNLLCIALTESPGGPVTGGTLVIEDITVVAGIEKRLAVSERMAAVGKLAARVAHELNNPLDGILRYLNLALRALELGNHAKIGDYLKQARGGLMRMTDIIRELASFSRSAYTAFDHTNLNAIVEEAVKVMSDKALAANVSIVCTFSEGLPAARGSNLFQVFCNMIKNAVDAMPSGGTLTISTQMVDREVLIRFEDTGVGLPGDLERIFEPFYTTKEPGKGTGLGLAICKDIVEKFNGKIVPERRPGGGAIFTIRIPAESCASLRPAGALS